MVAEAIHYKANLLDQDTLHAFPVMPNHVHLLLTPSIALPKLTRSLKNREFEQIRRYIANNPVRAGLTPEASAYRWSSAGWQPGGCPADAGVRPRNGPVPYDMLYAQVPRCARYLQDLEAKTRAGV
jgi:hypothetical protein